MNREGHLTRARRPVLPSFSTRTLLHPSFLPLYVAAGFARHQHRSCIGQTVHPIIPAEIFYTDPTVNRRGRIPNIVSDLGIFNCLQLNTPPPVMSACLAPPNRPDPFRSRRHPTRDLGSDEWRMNPIHLPAPGHKSQAIVQLTQEEDQAITNLLKLSYQEPQQNTTSAEEAYKLFCVDVQNPRQSGLGNQLQQETRWSHMELAAADTLLSRFSPTEEDRIWGRYHLNSAATLPDPLEHQHDKDSSKSPETPQGSEASPTLKAIHSTQNDPGLIRFTCLINESGVIGQEEFSCFEDRSVSGTISEVKDRMLSDSEGNAVHVLLSLGDMGTLDILQ